MTIYILFSDPLFYLCYSFSIVILPLAVHSVNFSIFVDHDNSFCNRFQRYRLPIRDHLSKVIVKIGAIPVLTRRNNSF